MLDSLKAFLWTEGSTSIQKSRITRTIRGNRCLIWITHVAPEHSMCRFWDNMANIHMDLSFSNLQKIANLKYEAGDARKEYSVIFELRR